MMRIALGHKSMSGKNTIADYLVKKHGFVKLTFEDKLYEVTKYGRYSQREPDFRSGMTEEEYIIARRHQDNFLGRTIQRQINAIGWCRKIVVSNVQLKSDFDILKKLDFITVNVNRPYIIRPPGRDVGLITETDLDGIRFDNKIVNDGDLDDLYFLVDEMYEDIEENQMGMAGNRSETALFKRG